MHQSVLLKEVVEWLAPEPGQTVVDGTVGAAGHAKALLHRMGPSGRLVGFDEDPTAARAARETLGGFGDRAMIVEENFRQIAQRLKTLGIPEVHRILLDLGVSSMQLEDPARGFSFKFEGPLDMRRSPLNPLTAGQVVNTYPQRTLEEIFRTLGEERFAGRIARRITEVRVRRRFETAAELAAVISEAVPSSYRHGRLHPATRVFQALRIAVNGELEALDDFFLEALGPLASQGRIAIISFHSLEDRKVKHQFKRWAMEKQGRVLTKKPVTPELDEVRDNPRSRSAKLRVFEKF